MNILESYGNDELARVFVADFGEGKMVEFVESVQPPVPRNKKWVLIVSTLFGCPVKCKICDSGGFYEGRLTANQILDQIDYLISRRYPDFHVPVPKFKIQFARMGDPLLNKSILDVLEALPSRYEAPGLMPCISTVAPVGSEKILESLIDLKERHYSNSFQMQFSIHSTNNGKRDELIPIKKLPFEHLAEFGNRFVRNGQRKIALNFAPSVDYDIDANILQKYFKPSKFLIKLTPINPTYRGRENNMVSLIDSGRPDKDYPLADALKEAGYDVILSIGESAENEIGSNCGQYIRKHGHKHADAERVIKL